MEDVQQGSKYASDFPYFFCKKILITEDKIKMDYATFGLQGVAPIPKP